MSASPWVADHRHPVSEIDTGIEIFREGANINQINEKLAAGKIVRLGQGIFNADTPLIVPSYSDFRCAGKIRTIIRATKEMIHMIKTRTVDTPGHTVHINLADFTLDQNSLATKGIEIGTDSTDYLSSEIKMDNIRVINGISGIICNSFVYSSISDIHLSGLNNGSGYGIKFANQTQECVCKNVVAHSFAYPWWITSCGVHMIKCVSYAETTDTNTVNLLLIQDGRSNKIDGCVFEYLGSGAINEVLLNGVSGYCPDNVFRDCYWAGMGTNSTQVAVGVQGGLAVSQTTIENGRFLGGESKTNINLVNQAYTNLLRNKRVTSYGGNFPYDLVLAGQDITATGGKQIKFNE